VGSHDSITYLSGIRYQRHVVSRTDGTGYDLELNDRPNVTARVLWHVKPHGKGDTQFSITVFALLKANESNTNKQPYQARRLGPVLEHYLASAVQGVAHFVVTGTAV
jgi:hypothetical protein